MSACRVFARRTEAADDPDGYTVPHPSFTYLLDKAGGYVTYFSGTVTAEDLADRLRDHLSGRRARRPMPVGQGGGPCCSC